MHDARGRATTSSSTSRCWVAEAEAQSVLWTVAHANAFSRQPALLDTVVTLSRHHGVQVCRALGAGVLDALEVLLDALTRGTRLPPAALWEQSLTVLYRVLFLLFAEARGLVPLWHPVYRDRYSLEAIVSVLLEGRSYKGLWRAIQAISRLAHAGCTAGELRVTAFNGRLFAPAQASAFDGTRLSDPVMSRTVLALSSTPTDRHGSRARILYRDLDVEQLGAVYERVLEYEPTATGPSATDAHPRRAQIERLLLHASRRHDFSGSSHARTARSRPDGRRDSFASRARSRHGERGVPRRRLPISGHGRRGGAHPGGALARARRHTGRSCDAPAGDRLPVPLRR